MHLYTPRARGGSEGVMWIKRRLDAGKLEAGEYRVIRDGMGNGSHVELACPQCAATARLAHPVRIDGAVIGRWACPSEACPTMTWLALHGWEGT